MLVGSEADLVVAIDQFGPIALGHLGTAEEVDLLGDDLAAVAVDARRIGPLRVVDAALNQDFMPFSQFSATDLPRQLKQVMRCHSVSITR